MRIFVTGATGYVGGSVAAALRRAGHEVWGLTRSREKARRLAADEIHPVLGSLREPAGFLPAAERCSILIHAAAEDGTDRMEVDRAAVEALLSISDLGPRPKTLVYTSGTWVYGDTGGRLADETTPSNPLERYAGRPEVEDLVRRSTGVRGVVLRPGCLYGGRGGMTGDWFQGASEGALRVVGDGRNRWAMVHADDAAEGYVRVVERALSGEVFNLTDRSHATVAEMAAAAGRAAGYEGEIRYLPVAEAAKTMGDFAACLAVDQRVDSRKAVDLLGWRPRRGSFVGQASACYESWKASR